MQETESVFTQAPNSLITLRCFSELRSSEALTTSYVDTEVVRLAPYNSLILFFDVTKGSLTSMQYQILQSFDGNTWFEEGAESISSLVINDYIPNYNRTLLANFERWFKVVNFYGNYLKLRVKGTGAVDGNSCAVSIMASRY